MNFNILPPHTVGHVLSYIICKIYDSTNFYWFDFGISRQTPQIPIFHLVCALFLSSQYNFAYIWWKATEIKFTVGHFSLPPKTLFLDLSKEQYSTLMSTNSILIYFKHLTPSKMPKWNEQLDNQGGGGNSHAIISL